jgi:hypothetical protein
MDRWVLSFWLSIPAPVEGLALGLAEGRIIRGAHVLRGWRPGPSLLDIFSPRIPASLKHYENTALFFTRS